MEKTNWTFNFTIYSIDLLIVNQFCLAHWTKDIKWRLECVLMCIVDNFSDHQATRCYKWRAWSGFRTLFRKEQNQNLLFASNE